MQWKPQPKYENDRITGSYSLVDDNDKEILWVRCTDGAWLASYHQGGVHGNDIDFDVPLAGAGTLDEAKALGVMLMHMGT